MNTRKRGFIWAKRITYFLSILAPIALVIFPNFFVASEDRIKVAVSLTGFLVLSLVFAMEDIKTFLAERHDDLQEKLSALQGSINNDSIHRSLRTIQDSGDAVFYKHVCGEIEELKGRLKQAELGVLELDEGELAILPIELATTVNRTLFATAFWNDDPIAAKKRYAYLDCLATARRERSVTIKRLFIISPGDENSEAFKKRLREEKERGFANRYILVSDWIKTGNIQRPRDFGIWDDSRVWLYTGDKNAASNKHKAELHNSRNTIELYRKAFQNNWDEATEAEQE